MPSDRHPSAEASTPEQRARIAEVSELFVRAIEARSLMQPSPMLSLDLTMPQLKALVALGARGPMRLSHLAEAIAATPTGVTGIVDRLSERGYLERSADLSDRRATVVGLLPAGDALLSEMYAAGRENIQQVLAVMSPSELDDVERGMQVLLSATLSLTEAEPS